MKFCEELMTSVSFRYIYLHCVISKSYKLTIILVSDIFLCTISTSTDYDYVNFIWYNLKVSHSHHVANYKHIKYVLYRTGWYVYDLIPCKFHMSDSIHSLVTAIKQRAKYRFCMTIMLFYIVQKDYINKTFIFFKILY
jgi:hypothetical protein